MNFGFISDSENIFADAAEKMGYLCPADPCRACLPDTDTQPGRQFLKGNTNHSEMKRLATAIATVFIAALPAFSQSTEQIEAFLTDSIDNGRQEILEQLANMPNIEVGKGITFRPGNDSYEMTIRFRMQNMLGLHFNDRFGLSETEAQIKRLRLRFDGYIFSPKFVYSIQLGFSSYDADPIPNGNMNLIRDAIVYFVPNSSWNIGFGQTKVKANRARVNSSSALQFVDRSIVNSEFGGDRDIGFFGEYYYGDHDSFALAAKASVTLGEGRNWNTSEVAAGGFAYTGRMELYPFGRLHGKSEYIEGDLEYEETPKLMLGLGYTFNDRAQRVQGWKGAIISGDQTRDIGSYYADLVFKYRGFAIAADYLGRHLFNQSAVISGNQHIYTGSGLNVQGSYLFDSKWELAARNSTMFPDGEIQPLIGYSMWNQSTIGLTRYIIGHSLKMQLDVSYNYMKDAPVAPSDRWSIRFQVELGL